MGKNEEVIGTGTAFLVYRDGSKRGLFLTCEHNFLNDSDGKGKVIRFSNGDKNYPIEEILYRHKKRDLLLFSVKDIPECQCLQLSNDKVEIGDMVVMVGYSSPTLHLNNDELMHLVLVKAPSILPGRIA